MNPELKTEKDYKEFARIGRMLGVPVFEAFLTIETFDKHCKRTSYHKQRSHSWTRNAYNLMFCQLAGKDADDSTFGAGLLSIRSTNGNVNYGDFPPNITSPGSSTTMLGADGTDYGYRGPASVDTWGILVGSGTNAESFEDYVLQTLIATGNGGGQLAYGEGEAHAITYTAGTKTLKNALIRYFNNNSGGSIDVNEIGLAIKGYPPKGILFLAARDKLGSGVDVADTGQLKVTYTISLVYAG